ncbi:MAG: MotA/TolQ/ExbB proton channel family protein [Planctomycetaceae bacterium]
MFALAFTAAVALPPAVRAQDDASEEMTEEEPAEEEEAPAKGKGKAAAAASEEDTTKPAEEQSYLSWLWEASGYEGLLIGLMSVALLAFIISNVLQLRLPVFVPPDFVKSFEEKVANRDYQGAYDLAKGDESFVAKLVAGGLSRASRGPEEVATGMAEAAEDENMALDHRLSYISIIGATAPMLGLLGTVHGMVSAFSVIANSTVSPKPADLAKGITMALVTTLEGLIVAIPAVIAFALFKNMQARSVLEASMAAENLLAKFPLQGKRPATPAPAATGPGTGAPPSA